MHYGGGYNQGGPPVDLALGSTRAWLSTLMRGATLQSMGAGGFGKVPALPAIQDFKAPQIAPSEDAELVQLYANTPAAFRQRLNQMFVNTSRARTGR